MAVTFGTPVVPREVAARPPERTFVLAVDLGTGGPKVAVVSATGRILAHAYVAVGLDLVPGGGAEQDPGEWWRAVTSAGRRALEESGVAPDEVVGVGCTAQWLGTVVVGDDGEAVGPAIIWMDSRGAAAVRRQTGGRMSVMGYDPRKLQRWVRLTGGAPSQSGKDPVGHILYLRESEPERYAAARVFLEPVDYLNLRLTGRACASFDSITMYWVTDNRRIHHIRYDPELVDASGLDGRTLPELVPTGSVVGGLTAGAAEALGLVAGTPVVTGTGDLHSAAVGSGQVADFAAHLYVGTSSWISCHVPYKKTDALHNVASFPSGIPGRYLVADEHETAGACLTFLRDRVLYPDDALSTGPAPDDFFDRLDAVASAAPLGAGGVLFTPWLNGERTPVDDHTIRGGFHNLSLSSGRQDMVRAVFEGVALNTRWLLGAVEHFVRRRFDALAFIGGGARSPLWAQIHADATGRVVRCAEDPVLANVRGAGLLAHSALGHLEVGDIAAMVPMSAEYRPEPQAAAHFDAVLEDFVALYKQTKGIHRHMNGGRLGT